MSLPGVAYPESLPTVLKSKRTSPKTAEQGRRSRTNTALQELQSLLPSFHTQPQTGSDLISQDETRIDERPYGATEMVHNSKATTVERAIEHIRYLQKEKDGMNGRRGNGNDKLIVATDLNRNLSGSEPHVSRRDQHPSHQQERQKMQQPIHQRQQVPKEEVMHHIVIVP